MRCCVFFFYYFSCAVRRNLGCNIPCCRGRGASSPTKQSPHIQKPLRQLPKHSTLFFNVFCTCFMPGRALFGIKRPAFTRGHGGDASPHIQRLSTNVRKSCAKRTMGVALPLPGRGGGISPHMKAFVGYFLKSSPQSLCPEGHHLGCNIPCCRGRKGEQPHKPKPPPPKTSTPVFQTFQAVFQRFLHLFYAREGIIGD